MTRKFKIYGANGHCQRESFCSSYTFATDAATIAVINSDVTGTNQFSIVIVSANSDEIIEHELDAQLWDGIFENSNFGNVEEF